MEKILNKRNVIILAVLALVLVIIIVLFGFKGKGGNEGTSAWTKYTKGYKDGSVSEKLGDEYYTSEFIKSEGNLYAVYDGNTGREIEVNDKKAIFVLGNIIDVYIVNYEDIKLVYAVDKDGNTYYINNIKNSSSDMFELTQLGDYKYITKIENKENKIIVTDVDKKEIEINDNVKNYIAYTN